MSVAAPQERFSAMVLGPIIWALHFLFVYIFQAVGCSLELQRHALVGFNLIDVVLLGGSLVLLALIVAGALRSLRAWRLYQGPQAGEAAQAQRRAFMAQVAFGLYLLSFLAVIWVTLPVVILPDPCRA